MTSLRVVALVVVSLCAFAESQPIQHLVEIAALTPQQAQEGRAVRVEAVVTRFAPLQGQLVLQEQMPDGQGVGVFVMPPYTKFAGVAVGDVVRLSGRTAPGSYGNVVLPEQIEVLRHGKLPAPVVVRDATQVLDTDALDNVLATTEGWVERVMPLYREGRNTVPVYRLFVRIEHGEVPVAVHLENAQDAIDLLHRKVKVTGPVMLTRMPRLQRHLADIVVDRKTGLEVLGQATLDSHKLPQVDAAKLLRLHGVIPANGWFRVTGTLVAGFSPVDYELYAGDNQVAVRMLAPLAIDSGKRYEVVARLARSEDRMYRIEVSQAKLIGDGKPPEVANASTMGLARGRFDGAAVTVQARLVDRWRESNECVLMLRGFRQSGERQFAVHERQNEVGQCKQYPIGSVLKVTGMVSHTWSDMAQDPVGTVIHASEPNGVAIVSEPPWYERLPMQRLLLGAVLLAGLGALWIYTLRRRVSEQTRALLAQQDALVAAKEAAEAASEAKSQFLANISHEIRTPLNGVMGMTALLEEAGLKREQARMVKLMRASAESLMGVLNDVLDFSKIEAGRLELDPQPVNIRELAVMSLRSFTGSAQEKGLEVAFECGDDVERWVMVDAGRLRQVLLNLLGNAVKFTNAGQVGLRVRNMGVFDGEVELEFLVWDTGVGIARDKLEMIFEAFSQAESGTSRKFGGTGLGLAISQRLVVLMGGRIEVTSQAGRGSEFRFRLRLKRAEAPVAAQRCEAVEGLRVLVVDDSALSRSTLEGVLIGAGMSPLTVDSAEEALAVLRRGDEPVDLILTDCVMPGVCGWEMVDQLQASEAWRRIPVVMMSAEAGFRHCRDRGVRAVLLKPVSEAELLETIEAVVSGKLDDEPASNGLVQLSGAVGVKPNGLRILLAEDNDVNQIVALGLLEHDGHAVTVVSNGLEAVGAAEHKTFDLVLMDVEMPEMDGFEAAKRIRAQEKAAGKTPMPIIAMTAHAVAGYEERCLAAGMDGYLTKPVRMDAVRAAIEKLPPYTLNTGTPHSRMIE